MLASIPQRIVPRADETVGAQYKAEFAVESIKFNSYS
jgi:hypothetical protein